MPEPPAPPTRGLDTALEPPHATGTYGVGWLGRYNATGNVLWSASIVGAGENDTRAISGLASDGHGGVFATGQFSTSANVRHSNGYIQTWYSQTPALVTTPFSITETSWETLGEVEVTSTIFQPLM